MQDAWLSTESAKRKRASMPARVPEEWSQRQQAQRRHLPTPRAIRNEKASKADVQVRRRARRPNKEKENVFVRGSIPHRARSNREQTYCRTGAYGEIIAKIFGCRFGKLK